MHAQRSSEAKRSVASKAEAEQAGQAGLQLATPASPQALTKPQPTTRRQSARRLESMGYYLVAASVTATLIAAAPFFWAPSLWIIATLAAPGGRMQLKTDAPTAAGATAQPAPAMRDAAATLVRDRGAGTKVKHAA